MPSTEGLTIIEQAALGVVVKWQGLCTDHYSKGDGMKAHALVRALNRLSVAFAENDPLWNTRTLVP